MVREYNNKLVERKKKEKNLLMITRNSEYFE